MAKALYYQENKSPLEFTVLKTHPNKSVDLGPEGGPAKITECAVTQNPEIGSCTLVEEKPAKKPDEDKGKK